MVIAPKSIQFSAASAAAFQIAPYPGQPDANVEVASNTQLGQQLAFKLSGEGMLAAQGQGQGDEGGQPNLPGAAAQPESRPGGGLGPPIDAPPPYQKYQWYILGGLALALVIGGVYVASRQQAANRDARAKGKTLPEFEDDEEYEPAEAFAVREAGSTRRSPSPAREQLVHAAGGPERRALPAGSRPHPRPHHPTGIRQREVCFGSNSATRQLKREAQKA